MRDADKLIFILPHKNEYSTNSIVISDNTQAQVLVAVLLVVAVISTASEKGDEGGLFPSGLIEEENEGIKSKQE